MLRLPVAAAVTIFVRSTAAGANNGTSWTNAFTSLQSGLAAAASGDEIWVAAGIYKPTATADRTISLALKNGVGVYGGFAGTETMRSQRNSNVNVTALSGDIGAAGVTTDNSYHVVTSDSTVTATGILDGFTVTAGRADGASDPIDRGADVYINLGSPAFVRCIFQDGYAINRGGGVRVAAGSPSFTDCTFRSNIAESAGAGLSAASVGSMQVRSCVFRNNTVNNSTGGGGIEATDNTTLVNSVVSQNAPNGMNFLGGNNAFINTTVSNNSSYGIALFSNPNSIVNSIIYGNPTGTIFVGISGIATVSYSDVQGGGFAGTGNIDANPLFAGAPTDLRLNCGLSGGRRRQQRRGAGRSHDRPRRPPAVLRRPGRAERRRRNASPGRHGRERTSSAVGVCAHAVEPDGVRGRQRELLRDGLRRADALLPMATEHRGSFEWRLDLRRDDRDADDQSDRDG